MIRFQVAGGAFVDDAALSDGDRLEVPDQGGSVVSTQIPADFRLAQETPGYVHGDVFHYLAGAPAVVELARYEPVRPGPILP